MIILFLKIVQAASMKDDFFSILDLYLLIENCSNNKTDKILFDDFKLNNFFFLKQSIISVSNTDCNFEEKNYTSSLIGKLKKKRKFLSPVTKSYLEKIFEKQPFPNRKERDLIAKKFGLSRMQIRIWVSIIFFFFIF